MSLKEQLQQAYSGVFRQLSGAIDLPNRQYGTAYRLQLTKTSDNAGGTREVWVKNPVGESCCKRLADRQEQIASDRFETRTYHAFDFPPNFVVNLTERLEFDNQIFEMVKTEHESLALTTVLAIVKS